MKYRQLVGILVTLALSLSSSFLLVSMVFAKKTDSISYSYRDVYNYVNESRPFRVISYTWSEGEFTDVHVVTTEDEYQIKNGSKEAIIKSKETLIEAEVVPNRTYEFIGSSDISIESIGLVRNLRKGLSVYDGERDLHYAYLQHLVSKGYNVITVSTVKDNPTVLVIRLESKSNEMMLVSSETSLIVIDVNEVEVSYDS